MEAMGTETPAGQVKPLPAGVRGRTRDTGHGTSAMAAEAPHGARNTSTQAKKRAGTRSSPVDSDMQAPPTEPSPVDEGGPLADVTNQRPKRGRPAKKAIATPASNMSEDEGAEEEGVEEDEEQARSKARRGRRSHGGTDAAVEIAIKLEGGGKVALPTCTPNTAPSSTGGRSQRRAAASAKAFLANFASAQDGRPSSSPEEGAAAAGAQPSRHSARQRTQRMSAERAGAEEGEPEDAEMGGGDEGDRNGDEGMGEKGSGDEREPGQEGAPGDEDMGDAEGEEEEEEEEEQPPARFGRVLVKPEPGTNVEEAAGNLGPLPRGRGAKRAAAQPSAQAPKAKKDTKKAGPSARRPPAAAEQDDSEDDGGSEEGQSEQEEKGQEEQEDAPRGRGARRRVARKRYDDEFAAGDEDAGGSGEGAAPGGAMEADEKGDQEEEEEEEEEEPVARSGRRGGRRVKQEDSDYEPDPQELAEAARAAAREGLRRGATGRRRATGQAPIEVMDSDDDAGTDIEDSDDEPEIEEEEDDVYRLPFPNGVPLPAIKYKFAPMRAIQYLRLMLDPLEIKEMEQMARILALPLEEMRVYWGYQKDRDTGEKRRVERKRTAPQWKKVMLEKLMEQSRLSESHGDLVSLKDTLKALAEDEDCANVMKRHLEDCFRCTPPIREDNSNLVNVMLKMWAQPVADVAPATLLLGTRTIHLRNFKKDDKDYPRCMYRPEGPVAQLLRAIKGQKQHGNQEKKHPSVEIDQSHHKTAAERDAILAWLTNACRAPAGVAVRYKIFATRAGRYAQVFVTLTRREVLQGPDLLAAERRAALDAGADVPDALDPANEEKCDFLALYKGLDHVKDGTAFVEEAHRKALHRAEELEGEYSMVTTELQDVGVQEAGAGPDGFLNMGQVDQLLQYNEGQEYDKPQNLPRILKKLKLKLKPYQVESLAAVMQEEQSCGTGRHLFVQLPVPEQPKYEPAKVKAEVEAREREMQELAEARRAARAEAARRRAGHRGDGSGDDEDSDDEDAGARPWEQEGSEDERSAEGEAGGSNSDSDWEAYNRKRNYRSRHRLGATLADDEDHGGMDVRERGGAAGSSRGHQPDLSHMRPGEQDHLLAAAGIIQAGPDAKYYDPEKYKAAEALREGVTPVPHLLYSPVFNAFCWGTNLNELAKDSKLGLPLRRGVACCLEVGMGKTAVALAASLQSQRSMMRHCGRRLFGNEPWDDRLLYDGWDGHPGHLHRGGTLVIAPKTLLPQWEDIEITKVLGRDFHTDEVVNSSGVSGKRRPSLPSQLARYKMVLINPEMFNKATARLYQSVHWERIILDEAHSEPGMLANLANTPHRTLIMLTGTPVVNKPDDVGRIFEALRFPSMTTLGRSAFRMGYVLRATMVRYTNAGTQLTGTANLTLPAKHEKVLQVAWPPVEKQLYLELEEQCGRQAHRYHDEILEAQDALAAWQERYPNKPPPAAKRSAAALNKAKLASYTKYLRWACSGLEVSKPEFWDDSLEAPAPDGDDAPPPAGLKRDAGNNGAGPSNVKAQAGGLIKPDPGAVDSDEDPAGGVGPLAGLPAGSNAQLRIQLQRERLRRERADRKKRRPKREAGASDEEEEEDEEGEEGDAGAEGDGQQEMDGWPMVFRAKFDSLINAMRKLKRDSPSTKMCIFSVYPTALEALKKELPRHGFDIRYLSSTMSMKQRSEALQAFMSSPPTTVFLLSAHIAAVGLTLVSASHMFILEPLLNPQQEIQAVGRIYRMGQTKEITVTRVMMRDGIEQRIWTLMRKRAAQARDMDFAVPANLKMKGGKHKDDGDSWEGVCASAGAEEILALYGN